MADNRQVYPLGLGMDQAAAAEEPAADPASAAPIFGHRLGCALHVLHLAVMAGMTNPCFMGPLGVASWHEPRDHLVALLGLCLVQHQPIQHLQRSVTSVSKSDCEALRPRGNVRKT